MVKKYLMALAALLLLASTQTLAQTQQVRVSVAATTSNNYQASVFYQPSDGKKTTGLGIRIHYPSAVIEIGGTANVLGGVTGLQTQADEANADNSVATDKYLNAAWFDLNGNWPSALDGEALLFRFDFSLKDPTVQRTVLFNVTRVSTASGYQLQASNYQAALGGSSNPPGGNPGSGGSGGGAGSPDSAVAESIADARQALSAAQSVSDIRQAVSEAVALITAFAGSISEATLAEGRVLSNDAARAAMQFFDSQINSASDSEVRALLERSPAALRFALDVAPSISSDRAPDPQLLGQAMAERGLSSNIGARLSEALNSLHALDSLNVGDKNAEMMLRDALGAGVDISTNPVTSILEIDLTAEKYHGAVLAVRMVGDLLPVGLRFLADGRALLIHDGIAFEIAPLAADMLGFIAAVERETFALELRSDGAVELNLGAGERFSGVFTYDNLAGGACEGMSFSEPIGAMNSPAYAYGVKCANGVSQRIVPFVQDSGFLSMQGGNSALASVDRNTGLMTIPGIGKFKAGFFISPMNVSDQNYFESNKNSEGLALRAVDVNGDGRQDFLLYSQKGVQPIYAVTD